MLFTVIAFAAGLLVMAVGVITLNQSRVSLSGTSVLGQLFAIIILGSMIMLVWTYLLDLVTSQQDDATKHETLTSTDHTNESQKDA